MTFIDDCAVEGDLEMYFPDNYVPGRFRSVCYFIVSLIILKKTKNVPIM